MRKLYPKLAAINIRNNRQFYLPYLLAGGLSVAMFYLVMAMQDNPGLLEIQGGMTVKATLGLGVFVVGVFAAILLFYTNSFIIKRRKKELGIYNILGMEKRHIAKVLTLEMLFTVAVTIAGGLTFGIVFNKLLAMILYRMTGLEASIPFMISGAGCRNTLMLFAAIYAAALCYNLMQIKLANPIELLHSSNVGEREPKTKILMTLIGLVTLGSGYYIALTVADITSAITFFFVAVLLVIIGTYCLFTAGSIALLKLLRKNKKYYYQAKHFTTVSGMIYRMKQNAVGLANICILSTMVLVTVSTTVCLYLGVEDALKVHYPQEISAVSYYDAMPEHPETLTAAVKEALKESGRTVTSEYGYLNMSMTAVRREDGFSVTGIGAGTDYSISDVALMEIVTKSDYEKLTGETVAPLEEDEIAVAATPFYEEQTLEFEGKTYTVKESYDYPEDEEDYLASMAGSAVYLIVPDETEFVQVHERLAQNWNQERVSLWIKYSMGCDIDGTKEEKLVADAVARNAIAEWESTTAQVDTSYHSTFTECREENRADYFSSMGGLLFLGLFLGVMFLMVTVLIIFYKQISEGYEDKVRYEIMEKVGMSNAEVRRSIRSQVLTVFFLPIVMAVVHIIMAFPMIKYIMAAFSLTNTTLFALCVVGTALVFFLIYLLVFILTSRSYYRIVGNQV
ncbi:MAG: ABC transporter permease [Clostridiales bacterium]|nr:ABC transporter permease [Roseburia sp.]MDD7636583.1 ABC transporter permease [Clostridiales bacterium]MDY4112786.1 ABC transporter permease [Roseburia sp.]